MAESGAFSSGLISLTPLVQSEEFNLVRISRTHHVPDDVHLVAGGHHKGIIVNKLCGDYAELANYLPWSFSVWLGGEENLRQEIRSFRFDFHENTPPSEQTAITQRFIKDLFTAFPKDYANFFKLVLKLMQTGFEQLRGVDVEMKFAEEHERMEMPNANKYRNDAEIENVTVGHVQDVLEHAYPNSLSVAMIADSLRCSEPEAEAYLCELEQSGIATRVRNQNDEWLRVDNFSIPESHHQLQSKQHPTVALITCLFVEKQSVDAIIENSSTLHKYSKAGDSNVYTIGSIGEHRVVATKLAMIGDSREATTSAGSITTRLLGSFQHVEHVIIVGVGGGVPHYTDSALHIRLGDVVVSNSQSYPPQPSSADGQQQSAYVYAHNFVVNRKSKQIEGFATHTWAPKDSSLARTLLNGDERFVSEWRQNAQTLVQQLDETVKGNDYEFAKPPENTDVLTMHIGEGNVVVIPHPNPKHSSPQLHLGPIGAMVTPHLPPSANTASPVKNPILKTKENIPPQPGGGEGGEGENGAMANGNGVNGGENNKGDGSATPGGAIQSTDSGLNSQLRDKFVEDYQLKSLDAGFDSVIAAVNGSRIDSWVLIRGVADYQQGSSRLGRQWQPYASANAAALVKTMLSRLPPVGN